MELLQLKLFVKSIKPEISHDYICDRDRTEAKIVGIARERLQARDFPLPARSVFRYNILFTKFPNTHTTLIACSTNVKSAHTGR